MTKSPLCTERSRGYAHMCHLHLSVSVYWDGASSEIRVGCLSGSLQLRSSEQECTWHYWSRAYKGTRNDLDNVDVQYRKLSTSKYKYLILSIEVLYLY